MLTAIGYLRGLGFVTTRAFLSEFGFDPLSDLPDMEVLDEAGLLSKEKLLAGDIPPMIETVDVDDDFS